MFVTSTFRDMHAERDYLRNHVFPALEERLRERFHHLEPIDLRWGVETSAADEQAERELLILKVCLADIERSRPFLIGLVGDRYGWVPPADRMRAAAEEARYIADVSGRSVTALEIEFGVLGKPGQRQRSRFYLREALPYDQMDPETAAVFSEAHAPDSGARARAERLTGLKTMLERELPGRVRRYRAEWNPERRQVTGLEAWARQVVEDLWEDLDAETRDYAARLVTTWQEQEARLLEQFVATACRDFVGRKELLERVCVRGLSPGAGGDAWGVCIIGPAGSGKSALFAELHHLFSREDVLLLAHAVGISMRSRGVEGLLRRWCFELAAFIGESDPSVDATTRQELEPVFLALLGRVARQRRVVCLLDALNQFEQTTAARHLTWLPMPWPGNARLIATTIPGTQSEALARRPEVETIVLPSLTEHEAEEIARSVGRRHHKIIHPEVVRALAGKRRRDGTPAAGNPLWLELALENLLLLDADDFTRAEREFVGTPEQRLHALILDVASKLPPDVETLYRFVLQRAEHVYGERLARQFANLVTASRSGWRESDLRRLLPARTGEEWSDLRFAALRRGLRAHVVQRGAQGEWDFHHAQMRESVRRRTLADGALVRKLHTAIADHLESLSPDDPLRLTEVMFHLIGADDRKRAARVYASTLSSEEEGGATQALAGHVVVGAARGPNPALAWVTSLASQPGLTSQETATICGRFNFQLNRALESDADGPTRLALLLATKEVLAELVRRDPDPEWECSLSISQEKVGDFLLRERGDMAGALRAYRDTLATAVRLAARHPDNGALQADLAASHEKIGDALLQQGDSGAALAEYRASLAICTALLAHDSDNPHHQRSVAVAYNKVGEVLNTHGDTLGALQAYRASLGIAERRASSRAGDAEAQCDLSASHERLSDVLMIHGDTRGSLDSCRAAVTISSRLAAQDPSNVVWQRGLLVDNLKLSFMLAVAGDTAAALDGYQTALVISERLAEKDPSNVMWQRDLSIARNRVAKMLLAKGDTEGALQAYRASLDITERLRTQNPDNGEYDSDQCEAHEGTGATLLARGDVDGAVDAYEAAVAVTRRRAARDPANALWQQSLALSMNRLGSARVEKGDKNGALEAYQTSVDLLGQLAARNPQDMLCRGNLATVQLRLGDLQAERGDAAAALATYRKCVMVLERLGAYDPGNLSWQHNLAAALLRLAWIEERLGDGRSARDDRRRCRDLLERMRTAGSPLGPEIQEALDELEKIP